jgi:hypothetical protein
VQADAVVSDHVCGCEWYGDGEFCIKEIGMNPDVILANLLPLVEQSPKQPEPHTPNRGPEDKRTKARNKAARKSRKINRKK